MLIPGGRVPVATPGISARAAAQSVAAQHAVGGLPRTPPRTQTGRTTTGGATGSTSRTSPGNGWSASTPIASSSSFTAPRTPSGATSPPPSSLRTPTAAQSTAAGTCMATQRRPARKSVTERPSQGVRGGVRAGLPGSGGQGSSQANTSSGTVWPVPLRSVGRGTGGRPSAGGSGQIGGKAGGATATPAGGYPSRHAVETPGSPRRCARSLSPPQAEPPVRLARAPPQSQPVADQWVNEDSASEQAVLHDTSMSRVIRTLDLSSEKKRLDLSSETSQLSSSPLSPLNERRQVRSAVTKGAEVSKLFIEKPVVVEKISWHEHADTTPPPSRSPPEGSSPKLRPSLYHNYPTLGLYA